MQSLSMSNVVDTSDISKLSEKLTQLEREVADKVLFKSVKAGGVKLKNATVESLQQKMGFDKVGQPIRNNKGGTYPPLKSGVRVSNQAVYTESTVHIMGHGFLKWFELGTAIRTTKSGANRGSIKAINFFFAARQSAASNIESVIAQTVEKELQKYLE